MDAAKVLAGLKASKDSLSCWLVFASSSGSARFTFGEWTPVETTSLAMLIGIVSISVLMLGLTIVALMKYARGSPFAMVPLTQPGPFAVALPPVPVHGPIEVWIRYSVAFPFFKPLGQPTSKVFGLVLEIVADGEKLAFGHGGTHPQGLLEFEGMSHRMTLFAPGSSTTPTRYTASVLVKRMPACPRTLQGAVYVVNGTMLNGAQIYLEKKG